VALLAYGAAKACEIGDEPIFTLVQVVSGHTLKHLLAAGGLGCVVAMVTSRSGRPGQPDQRVG
jgi:hypothetical protein